MANPDTTQKLTKKQKKSLAFRDRKSGKKASSSAKNDGDGALDMDDNAVPVSEDQDLAAMDVDVVEPAAGKGKGKSGAAAPEKEKNSASAKGKGKGKAAEASTGPADSGEPAKAGKSKKRKREDEEEGEGAAEGATVKKKKAKKAKEGGDKPGEETAEGKKKEAANKNQRFILFLGNLAYTTKKEAILAHFSVCDPPPTVRLLTPKPRPGVAVRPKSKGCAFLEFQSKAPLQQALKLHQSMLENRMINVELTAGGGGKSEQRTTKIQGRNKELFSQRQKKAEAGKGEKGSIPSKPDRPQRYSTTSGVTQAPTTARTWSVGDVVPESTHRGGKNAKRPPRGNRKSKSEGTGVNAIPVG